VIASALERVRPSPTFLHLLIFTNLSPSTLGATLTNTSFGAQEISELQSETSSEFAD